MKLKFQITGGFFFVCMLAGCASQRNLPLTKLEDTDQFKICVAVYGFMLNRNFWDGVEYSAIFLEGNDAEVSAVSKQFPKHIPPIKPSYRANAQSNRTPLDKDTGKPAIIFSVDATDATNNVCEAIGRWYAGPAVTGFYTFELKKSGDDWIVESAR